MHPALEAARLATEHTPFQGRLWLVGGAVRDELLGLPVSDDYDIVVEGDAIELAGRLANSPSAESAPVIYTRFGTAMVRLAGANVELVTARRENYDAASRKPHVEAASLEEDALRRDFTVNSLLRNLHTGELRDPLGAGLDDLKAKILRTPLDPAATFSEDPLRMLRAVRFRWKLGFAPAAGLYEAISEQAPRLAIISAERIRDEWLKMLVHPSAPDAMRDLMALGLLDRFAPEFRPLIGIDQGSYHHLDAWDHSLAALGNLVGSGEPVSPTLALAVLLHDIGKAHTRTVGRDGAIHFYQHERVGARMAKEMLSRLKLSQADIQIVTLLIASHMRLGSFDVLSAPAARRLIRDLGDQLEDLLTLVQADRDAHHPDKAMKDLSQVRARLAEVGQVTPREKLVSPLTGKQIMALTQLPPSPEVGRLKEALTEMVMEGSLLPDDQERAQAILSELLLRKPPSVPEPDAPDGH